MKPNKFIQMTQTKDNYAKKNQNIDEKVTKERNTNSKWIAVKSQVSLSNIWQQLITT